MASSTHRNKEQSAQYLARTVAEFSQLNSKALSTKLAPYLRDSEKMPDWELVQWLLARLIHEQANQLAAGNAASSEPIGDREGSQRLFRDEVTEQLYGVLREIKNGADAVYGPAALETLRLTQPIPRDFHDLYRLGQTVQGRLSALRDLVPVARHMRFPIAEMQGAIDTVMGNMANTLSMITPGKDIDKTKEVVPLGEGLERFDRIFGPASDALLSLLALGSDPERAQAIRDKLANPDILTNSPEPATPSTL